jgi:hypothetical protein
MTPSPPLSHQDMPPADVRASSADQTGTKPWAARLAWAWFAAAVVLVGWRITRGIDLSDESYYAIYLHQWFKEGVSATPFRMLHQTSVLLVYPFALLYRALVGGAAGLMLFLRCLYLAGATLSALVVVRFLRELGTGPWRWLLGALLVVFVPYNLPAPSYNTIGLQALLGASAAFGCALLAADARARQASWLLLSAAAWAVAVVSYPPLLAPLCTLVLGVALLVRPGRRFLLTYLLGLAAGQLLAWSAVFAVLGPRTIASSLEFQARLSSTFDPHATAVRITEIFTHNGWFTTILAVTLLLGGLRSRIPAALLAGVNALLIISMIWVPPALFSAAHDAVLVSALSGAALLGSLRRRAEATPRLLALLYLVSWVTGFAMAGTATLGHFKVPVGAVLAALVALVATASRCRATGHPRAASLPALALGAVLVVSLFQTYYGEPSHLPSRGRVRLTHGPFAGLAAAVEDAQVVEIAERLLREQQRPGDTLAVLGRFAGIYLLADLPIRALVPYAFTPYAQPAARQATHDYYASPANRPSLVLAYRDPLFPFINPFAPDFESWYVLQASLPTPLGRLEAYRRRD